eukprot:3531571-Pyramimonas_sp.AAC.1
MLPGTPPDGPALGRRAKSDVNDFKLVDRAALASANKGCAVGAKGGRLVAASAQISLGRQRNGLVHVLS